MLIPFNTLNIRPKGVLHVGASEGQEAQAYQDLGVGRVVWIEADPKVYNLLLKHLEKFNGQVALNACVSDVDADLVKFNIANNGGQSSSLLEFGTHTTVHPEVKFTEVIELTTIRIDTLMKKWLYATLPFQHGLDFLNIDLQGAELLALNGMGDLIYQFKWAYLEVNWKQLYKGCPLFPEIVTWMKAKGFKCEKFLECGNTGWGDAFFKRI